MRVKIEKAGGFAGNEETVAAYDTDDLPEREAAKVYGALTAVQSATGHEAGGTGAGLVTYRIIVGDGAGKVYTVPGEPSPGLAGALAVLLGTAA